MATITEEKLQERDLDEQIDDVNEILGKMSDAKSAETIRALIDLLQAKLSEIEDKENIIELRTLQSEAEDAINRFLDIVDRPCGTRKFIVSETGERDRALIGLYDAIGRRF